MKIEQEFLLKFVSTEQEARAEFDGVGPSKPIVPMLKRWVLARSRWILLWCSAVVILFPRLNTWRLFLAWILWNTARWMVWFYRTRRVWPTNQFSASSNLKDQPYYQEVALLKRGWEASPAIKQLLYQPREGWCGYATVNTVLRSIGNDVPLLHYESSARHISLSEMERLLVGAVNKSKQLRQSIDKIEVFSAEFMDSVEDLRRHCRMAMQPEFRYLVIFHRAPLFFNDFPAGVDRRHGPNQYFAAHWSPLISYLPEHPDDLVFVGDVNEKYGPWLCPVSRLYDSIRNRSFIDGGEWRGLIRLTVNSGSNKSSLTEDPAFLTPEDAVDRFVLNKVAYYRHVGASSKDGYMWHETHGSLTSFGHSGPVPFFKLIANTGRCSSEAEAQQDMHGALQRFKATKTMAHVLVRGTQPDQSAWTLSCFGLGMIPVSLRSRPPKSMMWLDLRHKSEAEATAALPKGGADKNPFQIRELLPGDSNDLWDLLCRCVCESYSFFSHMGTVEKLSDCFSKFFHAQMNCGPGHPLRILIAQHKETGELAGSVACFVTPGEKLVGSMYNVTVCPRFGRQGLGARLTCAALDMLRRDNLCVCVLQASPDGLPLYQRLGFKPTINDIAFLKAGFVDWPRLGPVLRLIERYIQLTGGLSPAPLLNLIGICLILWWSIN